MIRNKWPIFFAVVAIVFACFTPVLRNTLLAWDDSGYITENVHLRGLSLETVRWAFTEFHCNYWAPVTWLSLAVDYAAWGLDPFGYHLTNALLHAFSAGLVFLIALRLFALPSAASEGAPGLEPRLAVPCAAFAALLFGVHPLRVESVAWAAERKDVLSMAFGLGAVLAYLEHARREAAPAGATSRPLLRLAPFGLGVVLYALSLLAKGAFLTLPFALLVLDAYPLRRLRRRAAWLEKLPLLALSATAAVITARAMAPNTKSLAEIDLSTRVLTAFTSIARYLRLFVFPADISPVYLHPGKTELTGDHVDAIVVVVALTALAIWMARRGRPVVLVGWLLFLGTLLPVLGLTQNGNQELAPRFTYVPSIALSIVAALGISRLIGNSGSSPRRHALGWTAAAGVLALLGAVTVRDIAFWRDDVALWGRVIELGDRKFGMPYAQRAYALERAGDLGRALADMDAAVPMAAQKKFGGLHEVLAHRSRLRAAVGDLDGAAADLSWAADVSPEHRETYLAEIGRLHGGMGSPSTPATPHGDAALHR